MKCEFGGSWLRSHNVTAGFSENVAGIYFDRNFIPLLDLLTGASRYTREFTEHAKLILETCEFHSHRSLSDYCIGVQNLRTRNKENAVHAYMTMVTDAANVTLRWSGMKQGHLDIYTTLRTDVDSTQIGGLLIGAQLKSRRGDSPLLASSVGAVHDG